MIQKIRSKALGMTPYSSSNNSAVFELPIVYVLPEP